MMISAASSLTPEETVYLFSREVEHSDLNLNALISWFEEELD
jgi:lysine-N-methylase